MRASSFAKRDIGDTGYAELVDAVSIPAMTLAEAVESMRVVVKAADEYLEQERKEFIAEMAGQLVNLAFTIYEMVEDPSNALTTMLGFLIDMPSKGGTRKGCGDAAASRRGMSDADIDKMPPRYFLS